MSPDLQLRMYLVRAAWMWCGDNGLNTMLVARNGVNSSLPEDHLDEDGKIVFDISRSAVRDLEFGDAEISFAASFGGVRYQVRIAAEDVLWAGSPARRQGIGFSLSDEVAEKMSNPASEEYQAETGSGQELRLV